MTVAQLIKKLQKMPQDAVVTISNTDVYINGEYKATTIETYSDGFVEICTDYKKRISE